MRSPPSRGGPRLLYTHRTPSRRVPLARRPPAAAAASPPLTRACLISAYSDVHSGRPLERAPRLARAHRAALARPSARQAPSRVPSGRFIARDAPPCGARRKPETAARVDRARRSTSLRRTTSRRATHALAAFREAPCASSTRTARLRAVVPLARRPPAAAVASPPLTRACLISAYSEIHSGRPLERAPRLARAHRAAVARPSARQAPSRVPSGRFIARDAPPCGARRKPETAARVDRARRSTSLRRTTSRRATHALAAFARRAAPSLHAPHAFAPRAFGEKAACSRSRLSASHTSMPHLGILRRS